MTDGTGITSFTPDPLGRIKQLSAPNTGTVSYGYNARGQRTKLTYPDSTVIDYSYLADGQLDTVTQGATMLADYTYDGVGRVQQVSRANGATTSYIFDGADRLLNLRTLVGMSEISRFQYQVDRVGMRRVVTETLQLGATNPTATPTTGAATATPTTGAATATPTSLPTATPGSATRIKTITLENGSLTDPTTGADSVAGTVQLETTAPLKGTTSAKLSNVGASYMRETWNATPEVYVSFYFKLLATPASSVQIISFYNSTQKVGNLQVTTGRQLQLRNNGNAIGALSPALSLNTVYRIGLRQKAGTGANGVLEAFVATGDTAFGTAFASSTAETFTTSANEAKIGVINATPTVNLVYDTIAIDSAAMPGPDTGTVPTSTPTATSGATATPTNTPTTTPTTTPTATPGSGTRLRLVTFENASLTDAVTGLTSTTGTVSRDTSAPIKGTASFQVPNSTGFGRITLGSQTEVFIAFYLRLASVPSGPVRILNITNTSGTVGNLAFSSGKLQLRTGTTTIGTTASALQANTTYHIAIRQKSGTGNNAVLEAFIVDTTGGDIAFGAPFAQKTNDIFTTTTDNVQIGSTNNTALDARFDNIDIDTGALPGPSASAPSVQVARVAATDGPLVAATQHAQQFTLALGDVVSAPLAQSGSATRTIRYGYDGLNRLTSAQESGSTTATFAYSYDLAGNRTDGGRTYNAANQLTNVGYTYDNAGNMLADGTTSYTYDALGRVTTYTTGGQARTNSYNADGTLVAQVLGGITTRYTQDLASSLSQVLNSGGANYVYGAERLYASTGDARTWYQGDALGSVRQTLSDAGVVQSAINYDPWGQVQSGTVPTFGFTGEVQDGSNVYLRARWYNSKNGSFVGRDPFQGMAQQPYSLHPYQYGYANPVLNTDPSGRVVVADDGGGGSRCPAGSRWNAATRMCTSYGSGGGGGGSWSGGTSQSGGLSRPVVPVRPPPYVPVAPQPQAPLGPGMPFNPMPPAPAPPPAPIPWWEVVGSACGRAVIGALSFIPLFTCSGPCPEAQSQPQPLSQPTAAAPTPTSTPERIIRVRHYSQRIDAIQTSMRIRNPLEQITHSIFAEYPITTANNEKAIQATTESFYRPLNGRGGFVEFNVDLNKWPVIPDPNLAGIVSNAIVIQLFGGQLGMTYLKTGFPLDEPGINAQFFDWKGTLK